MSKLQSRTLILAIWAVGLVPAALLMMWLGYAERSWLGFAKAWIALLALMFIYEVFEWWVGRALRRWRERRGAPRSDT